MNKTEAAQLVALVLGAYPSQAAKLGTDLGRSMVASFALLLDDVSYAQAEAALRVIAKTEKFMPSVAEIRGACLELARGPKRPGVDAWGDVVAARSFRDKATMSGVDPITLHICREFGWVETRTVTRSGVDIEQWHVVSAEKSEAADRARFIEYYDKLVAQGHRETVAPELAAAREERRGLAGSPFLRVLEAAKDGAA